MEAEIKENVRYVEESNYCVCCGEEIPEGTMICKQCQKEMEE